MARPDDDELSEETSLGLATVNLPPPTPPEKLTYLDNVVLDAIKVGAPIYVRVLVCCHLLATLSLIALVTLWTVTKLVDGENLKEYLAHKTLAAVFFASHPYRPALAIVALWSIIGCNACEILSGVLFREFEWLLYQFVWLAVLGLATAAAVFGLNVALPVVTEIVGGRDLADALIVLFGAIIAVLITKESVAFFWDKSNTGSMMHLPEQIEILRRNHNNSRAQRLRPDDITD